MKKYLLGLLSVFALSSCLSVDGGSAIVVSPSSHELGGSSNAASSAANNVAKLDINTPLPQGAMANMVYAACLKGSAIMTGTMLSKLPQGVKDFCQCQSKHLEKEAHKRNIRTANELKEITLKENFVLKNNVKYFDQCTNPNYESFMRTQTIEARESNCLKLKPRVDARLQKQPNFNSAFGEFCQCVAKVPLETYSIKQIYAKQLKQGSIEMLKNDPVIQSKNNKCQEKFLNKVAPK